MKLNARMGRHSIAFCYGLLLAFMPILASREPFFSGLFSKGNRLQQKMQGLKAKLFGASGASSRYPAAYQVPDTAPAQVYYPQAHHSPLHFSLPPTDAAFREAAPNTYYENSRRPSATTYYEAPGSGRAAPTEQYLVNPNAAHEVNNYDNEAEFHDHFDDQEAAAGQYYKDDEHDNDRMSFNRPAERELHSQTEDSQHESDHNYEEGHENEYVHVDDEDHPHGLEHHHHHTDGDYRSTTDDEFERHHEADSEPDDDYRHSPPISSSSGDNRHPIDHLPEMEEGDHHDRDSEESLVVKQPMVNGDDDDDDAHYVHSNSIPQNDEGDEDEEDLLPRQDNLHQDEFESQGHPKPTQVLYSQMEWQKNVHQESRSASEYHDEPKEDQEDHDVADGTRHVSHQNNDDKEEDSQTGLKGQDSVTSNLNYHELDHYQSPQERLDYPSEAEQDNTVDDHADVAQSLGGDLMAPLAEEAKRQIPGTLGTPKDSQISEIDPKLHRSQFAHENPTTQLGADPIFDESNTRNWLSPRETEINQVQEQKKVTKNPRLESEFQDDDEFWSYGMEDLYEPGHSEEQMIPVDTFEVFEKFVDDPSSNSEPSFNEESLKVEKSIDDLQLPSDELEPSNGDQGMEVTQPKDSKGVEEPSVESSLETKSINEELVDGLKKSDSDLNDNTHAANNLLSSHNPEDLAGSAANEALDKTMGDSSQLGSEVRLDADRTIGANKLEEAPPVDGNTLLTPSISAALIPDEPEDKKKAIGGIGFEFVEPPKVLLEASSPKVVPPSETLEPQEEPSSGQNKSRDIDIAGLPKMSDSIDKPEEHIEELESPSALDEKHHIELDDDNEDSIDGHKQELSPKPDETLRPSNNIVDFDDELRASPIFKESPNLSNEISQSGPRFSSINDGLSLEGKNEKPAQKSETKQEAHSRLGNDEDEEAGKTRQLPEELEASSSSQGKGAFNLEPIHKLANSIHNQSDAKETEGSVEDSKPKSTDIEEEADALDDRYDYDEPEPEDISTLINHPEKLEPSNLSRSHQDRLDLKPHPKSVISTHESHHEEEEERPVKDSKTRSAGTREQAHDSGEQLEVDTPRKHLEEPEPSSSSHAREDTPVSESSPRVMSSIHDKPHEENAKRPVEDSKSADTREQASVLDEDDEHPEANEFHQNGEEHQLTKEAQLDHDKNDQVVEGKDELEDNELTDPVNSEEIKAELASMPLPPMLDAKGLEMTKKRRFMNGYKLNTNRNRIPKLNHRLSIETDDWNPERELFARREGRPIQGVEDSATGEIQKLSKNSEQLAEILASTSGNRRIGVIAYKPKSNQSS